jgi:hypothetical protein
MATYDPNKTYTWGPDTKFVLSGQDFSLVLHTIRGILSTKEASNVVLAYELNKKIEAMLGDAVAEGKVVEAAPQGQEEPVAQYEEVMPVASSKKAKLVKK